MSLAVSTVNWIVFAAGPPLFLSCPWWTPVPTEGTVNVTEVSAHDWIVAAVVPKSTDPVDAPKPLPAMVTFSPGWPTVGPIEPTCGPVADAVDCHTATVCAGSVKDVTAPPPPTVIPEPPSNPPR